MGCILNNDGLGAGLEDFFPQEEIHGLFTIVGEGLRRLKARLIFEVVSGIAEAMP